MLSKIKYPLFVTLIIICVAVSFAGFLDGIDWGDDFAGYIIQAQTLASGDFTSLKANMSRNDFVLNYPWGFPIVLAPVISHFETDLVFIKKYIFLFFVISLVIAYFLFRREKEYALLAILLTAASPYFWYFKSYLFSDFPNLCFVMLSLLLIDKTIIKREKLLNQYFDNCLIGIAIFASFTMRTQSFVLLITLAIMQVFYSKREILKVKNLIPALIPYVVFFILKIALTVIIPVKEVSYLGTYRDVHWMDTIGNNLLYYLGIWKELYRDVLVLRDIDGVVTGISIFLFFIGLTINWRDNLLYLVFVALFTGVLILTPFYQGLRYMIPLIPIFFYFLVKGIFHITTTFYNNYKNLIAYVLLAPLIIYSFKSSATLSYDNIGKPSMMDGPYSPLSVELFDFLKTKTPKESLVGYWKPRAMLLYSNRNGIIPHTYNECMNRKVDYYVYYRNAYCDQMSLDSILAHADYFKNVFENADFKVFGVIKDPLANAPAELRKLGSPDSVDFVTTIDYTYFDASSISEPEKIIGIYSNGAVTAKDFKLDKGNYILSVYSKGTKAGGEMPLNKILLNNKEIGLFYGHEEVNREDLKFTLDHDTTVTLQLKLENDFYEEKTKEDRNTLVYFMNIYKVL